MTYNKSSETSSESSEAAMAEAIESIIKSPQTNLEAIKALNMVDEEFYKPWLLDQKYDKHVLGKEGDRWAYFKNKKWSKEDYEKKAEELQEIPVDNKNVFGYKNEDGSISKYFQNTPEKYYVVYRIVDGIKKTITFYSLRNSFEYLKKKGEDSTKYGPNQKDLELGEALRLL
jgi:methyltransferase-like protein